MKKNIYLCALFIVCFTTTQAQSVGNAATSTNIIGAITTVTKTKSDTTFKDGWKTGGIINISFTEAQQNTYWTQVKGGGNLQFYGVKGIISYNFNRKRGKITWLNSFNGRYAGSSSNVFVNKDSSTKTPFTKNDDYLNFTSIYGVEMNKDWSFAGMFSLESQFDHFLTPGYVKLGPGFLYKPNDHFNFFVSPLMANLTTKLTAGSLPISKFGVDSAKRFAFDLGAFARASLTYTIAKGITYTSTADAYSNYLSNTGNLVLDWNNLFTFTVNKYIGATLSFNFRYNDLEVSRLQTQQGIGIGFNYNLK